MSEKGSSSDGSNGSSSAPAVQEPPNLPTPSDRGLVGEVPHQEGDAKFVSRRRFLTHARKVRAEAVIVRKAMTEAAASATLVAQEASNDRADHAAQHQSLLVSILDRLGDVVDAVKALPASLAAGRAVENIDSDEGSEGSDDGFDLGHSGMTYGSDNPEGGRGGGASTQSFIGDASNPARLQSEGEKEAAAADRKFLRREWADVNRRAHWLLSGAQPMDHSKATLQGILGHSIDVTSEVHDMIATLNGFKVRAFGPWCSVTADSVPLETRMRIMSQAVIKMVAKSIPSTPGREQQWCLRRVKFMFRAFKEGVDTLVATSVRCPRAMTDPSMKRILADYIDRDMSDWTARVHCDSASVGHNQRSPPPSETTLPPILTPEWVRLKAFLASGA